MKLKKIYLFVLIMIMFFISPIYIVFAEDISGVDQEGLYKKQIENIGGNDLFKYIPDSAKKYFDDNNLNEFEIETFKKFTFKSFIENSIENIIIYFKRPIKILFIIIGIILFSSMASALKSDQSDKGYVKAYDIISILSISGVLIYPTIDLIYSAIDTIGQASSFILMFLPVFISILIASGKTISALTYNSFLFGTVQLISQVASKTLVPLTGIYMTFSIAGVISDYIDLKGISDFIKKTVTWSMGILLTTFVSLLTLQGIVSTSADTVATKAAKFALSSFVPVIGGALSEAFNSLQGCLSFIKSTVGVFGVITILLAFMPTVISILLMIFSINISCIFSEVLNTKRITDILKVCSSTLSLILIIVLCFAVLLIVSTTVMLVLGVGV